MLFYWKHHWWRITLLHRLYFYGISGTILGITALTALYFYMSSWSEKATDIPKAVDIYFPAGTKLNELAGALESSQLIDSAITFKLWVRFNKTYDRFQAGQYRFSGKITPALIQKKMVMGHVFIPMALQFVIPEGFTLRQTVKRLVANGVGEFQEVWSLAHDPSFLKELNIKAKGLEGYLYPATYSFPKREKPRTVLRKMVATFWENLPENYLGAIEERGLTLTEAVTFASMIELETLHDDERPKVAEVIWNRLKNKEPLAIDAALIYGIKDYQGDIKWKHLKDRMNPYNTRVFKGLPPGPIGAVSRASLKAVLEPTQEGYYYYVLIAGSNRHHFSKTLKEHNKYVKLLLDGSSN